MILRRTHMLRLLLLLALGAGCRGESPAIVKTLLAKLPLKHIPKTTIISEDGKAYAYVITTPDGERVVTSAGAGEIHGKCTKLAFAPKSHRLFYWARDGSNEQPILWMVADGKEIATDFITSGEIEFSADGTRWIGAGLGHPPEEGRLGDITLFVDGVQMTRTRDLGLPSFSVDGRNVAYLAKTDGPVSLFVNGEKRQTFEPPTSECGAAALRAASQPDLPLRHIVKYLADGSLLVVTRDPDGWGVYVDGHRIVSYARATIDQADGDCQKTSVIATRSLRTAEGAPVAFWWERVAGEAELWRVVRNGRPVDDVTCVEPWRRHPPEPSADGDRVVYACSTKSADGAALVFLVKDGVRYGPYDNVWGIAPTKSGAHVGYGAARGTGERPWAIYVDGEPRVDDFRSTWRPRLSEDGATLVWEAMKDDAGRGFFGIDEHRLGSFDEVLWGPEFEVGDRVAWVVRRGRKITRISVPISAARAPRHPRAVVHVAGDATGSQ